MCSTGLPFQPRKGPALAHICVLHRLEHKAEGGLQTLGRTLIERNPWGYQDIPEGAYPECVCICVCVCVCIYRNDIVEGFLEEALQDLNHEE